MLARKRGVSTNHASVRKISLDTDSDIESQEDRVLNGVKASSDKSQASVSLRKRGVKAARPERSDAAQPNEKVTYEQRDESERDEDEVIFIESTCPQMSGNRVVATKVTPCKIPEDYTVAPVVGLSLMERLKNRGCSTAISIDAA